MKDSIISDLNEIGFVYLGDDVEVTDVDRFKEEEETVHRGSRGRMIPEVEVIYMIRLHFADGRSGEFKMSTINSMIEHAKDHGVL